MNQALLNSSKHLKLYNIHRKGELVTSRVQPDILNASGLWPRHRLQKPKKGLLKKSTRIREKMQLTEVCILSIYKTDI